MTKILSWPTFRGDWRWPSASRTQWWTETVGVDSHAGQPLGPCLLILCRAFVLHPGLFWEEMTWPRLALCEPVCYSCSNPQRLHQNVWEGEEPVTWVRSALLLITGWATWRQTQWKPLQSVSLCVWDLCFVKSLIVERNTNISCMSSLGTVAKS